MVYARRKGLHCCKLSLNAVFGSMVSIVGRQPYTHWSENSPVACQLLSQSRMQILAVGRQQAARQQQRTELSQRVNTEVCYTSPLLKPSILHQNMTCYTP